MASDHKAKAAVQARDEFKRENGKDSPALVTNAASEVAAARNAYDADNVDQPQWLKNG